jgi:CO/xanthine dehydrogenase Mo-binding subunit
MSRRLASAATSAQSRRRFLQTSAAAGTGLIVSFYLPRGAGRAGVTARQAGASLTPNAFVRIAPDNTVTVLAKHIEMGQGAYTGLATILCEELDADWGQVRVESAPADATRYNNLAFGTLQGTGGSTAMANSWEQAEKAGWNRPPPKGRARGIAVHESFNSFVAQVAEVSRGPNGQVKVERVVCVVDCGVAINPDVIRAQMEGGIGYGLGAALYNEVTIEKGRATVQLPRLSPAAHRGHAGHRGPHRPIRRAADRRW